MSWMVPLETSPNVLPQQEGQSEKLPTHDIRSAEFPREGENGVECTQVFNPPHETWPGHPSVRHGCQLPRFTEAHSFTRVDSRRCSRRSMDDLSCSRHVRALTGGGSPRKPTTCWKCLEVLRSASRTRNHTAPRKYCSKSDIREDTKTTPFIESDRHRPQAHSNPPAALSQACRAFPSCVPF